jgi:hypothetical protein
VTGFIIFFVRKSICLSSRFDGTTKARSPPALSKDYQGNVFKRALCDAQRDIDKFIHTGAQGGLQWHNRRYFKGQ